MDSVDQVCIFTAYKKNGGQGIIVGARRANLHLAHLDSVALASAEASAEFELDYCGKTLYHGELVIKHVAYLFEFPECLRQYMCLPSVRRATFVSAPWQAGRCPLTASSSHGCG